MSSPLPPENPLPTLLPPQPPLDDHSNPPVVHGIDAVVDTHPDHTNLSPPPSPTMQSDPPSSPHLVPVRPGDLAAFAQLFARFHTRVEKAAAGRKYRPLRDAFDSAAAEIAAHPDKVHMDNLSELVIDALRLGCESRKTAIVDACLDCIHRLFEYAHLGAASDASQIRLDARPPALDEVVAMVCACLEVKDEDVYLRMVQTLLTATTRTRTGLHQGTLLAAVRTIYNIYLNARTLGTRTTARVSLTQVLNLVFSRMEAETAGDITSLSSISSSQAVDVPKPAEESESHFASVLQKDAYLLFRALCKLSAKEVVDPSAPDAVALRSKLLSLELIRNLITNSGPAFRSGERFIYALRHYLTPSLLVNCMLNSPDVMDISFDIFEILLRKDTLRPLLKTEISAMFDTVVFRFLESPTAGPLRKRRAITLLNRLSSDRQTMADLFLNYDCDMESPKIFERMCNVVSTAAQHKPPLDSPVNGVQQATAQPDVKRMALTSVTQIVRSLREWSKPIEDSKGLYKDTSSDSIPSETPSELTDEEAIQKTEVENGAKMSNGKIDAVQSPQKAKGESSLSLNRSTSGSVNVGIISEGNDRDTTRFEETLKAKRDTAHGISLFNTKPKRGIEYLVKNSRLKQEPLAVAEFLHKAEDLDATMIGEYLGESGTFNLSVMHAYTDMHDFTDMTFDNALRLHLSGFRLPGEAQKIDRIMEKFASRYCECNPTIFANADAAYVLAYSTIMLHTDAHNDTIKNKMTKDEFIKNNRGINDGGDLDPTFLGNLYDRITTTEIRLTSTKKDSTGGDSKALNNASNTMNPAQRAKQFEEESERLMAQTKVLFAKNRRPAQDYTYYPATNVHLARLMFETAWYPVLAAISLNLEEAQPADTGTIALCLDCFRNGIAIASTFGIVTSKDAFVSSLAKFTHLHSIAEMRPKNVECIRMILAIAALEGNNLGDQWVLIVRAISQLEQVRAVASGNPGKFILQKEPLKGVTNTPTGERNGFVNGRKSSGTITVESTSNKSASSQNVQSTRRNSSGRPSLSDGSLPAVGSVIQRIDPKAASMASTIAESEIERIFSNSSKLSSAGVSDLCAALCTVALDELSEKPAPRIFCMQKIVEIAYYNMESRTRLEWGKIWEKMGQFFASSMCHSNRSVSMYAVDALRQLSSKFLGKDELSNFSFQRSFLKPFEACFAKSKVIQIREFVLTCVSQLVHARAHNIKSGWKSVFSVLALAADDKVDDIMKMGWELVDSITRKYLGTLDDVYVDAVMGVTAYTRTMISTDVPIAAISLLSGHCAFSLGEGKALSSLFAKEAVPSKEEDGDVGKKGIWFTADTETHIGSWFPILTGLAAALQDERSQVRTAANAGLFKVLEDYGGHFSPDLWVLIFRGVISPVFDDVGYLSSSADRVEGAAIEEWATTTGLASMKSLVDVFEKHISVTRTLLQDLLDIIRRWVLQETEFVAREGMFMLDRLISKVGSALNNEDWNLIVKHIHTLFIDTIPHEILGPDGGGSRSAEPETLEPKEVNGVLRNPSGKGDSQYEPNGRIREELVPSDDEGTGNTQDTSAVLDENEELEPKRVRFKVVRAKCVVQLHLIKVVQKVVVSFYKQLSTEHILDLSESLSVSYLFAHNFNANIDLRFRLWRTGFMNQVPNLLMQETQGLTACLRLLFWVYLDHDRVEQKQETEAKVMSLCEGVLRTYINSCYESKRNAESEERREVTAFSSVISFIVQGMMQLSHDQFERQLPSLYSILLDLMDGADDNGVRTSVTNLFRARITPTARRPGKVSSDSWSSQSLLVGHPQLPGEIRERVVRATVGGEVGPNLRDEICKALEKVCGVESVVPISSDKSDTFTVMSAAPDEMLVAGAMGVGAVRAAFVEAPDRTLLD